MERFGRERWQLEDEAVEQVVLQVEERGSVLQRVCVT